MQRISQASPTANGLYLHSEQQETMHCTVLAKSMNYGLGRPLFKFHLSHEGYSALGRVLFFQPQLFVCNGGITILTYLVRLLKRITEIIHVKHCIETTATFIFLTASMWSVDGIHIHANICTFKHPRAHSGSTNWTMPLSHSYIRCLFTKRLGYMQHCDAAFIYRKKVSCYRVVLLPVTYNSKEQL